MPDTLLVTALLVAALALGAVVLSRRRLAGVRSRLLTYLAAAAPEMAAVGPTATGIRVRVLGTEIEVDLVTLLRRRPRAGPETVWFDDVLAGIRARVPLPDVPPLALVEDRIMPLVKPRDFVALFERYPAAQRLVSRPLTAGVEITYTIRGVHQLTAVTRRALDTWRLPPDSLHTLAVANLRTQTAHLLEEIGGPRHRYEHLDGLDATRILVADMLVPPGVEKPVAAIPEESVLLLAPAAGAGTLAAEAATLHEKTPRPLSPDVFELTPTGPVPLARQRR
jgi:hypothetical protein